MFRIRLLAIMLLMIVGGIFSSATAAVVNPSLIFQQEDEFKTDEFKEDEFKEDEFKEDEFKEFSEEESEEFKCPGAANCQSPCGQSIEEQQEERKMNYLYWIIGVLGATLLAGILVRFHALRSLRGFFLMASLLLLGFFNAACIACPVDGIQNLVLYFILPQTSWHYLVWFVGIVVITYVFGKVWCGWICHWGALQEFLYLPGRYKILQGEKALLIGRIIRYVLLAALILQLVIMGTKYWCQIDPFISVFTFPDFFDFVWRAESYDTELVLAITLVLLLIVSSVFTYRPFCRTMCPVGLILGWISYIPGASVIGLGGNCAGCKLCSTACKHDAIIRKGNESTLRNSECIACGDCLDACKQQGLHFFRKNKQHRSVVHCKNECKN